MMSENSVTHVKMFYIDSSICRYCVYDAALQWPKHQLMQVCRFTGLKLKHNETGAYQYVSMVPHVNKGQLIFFKKSAKTPNKRHCLLLN